MDRKSFEYIYNQYWEELFDFGIHYCKDAYKAEGIVQEVFLSIWERLDTFVTEGDIKAYLYKAVKNRVFDHYRQQAKKQLSLDQMRVNACEGSCFTENEVAFNELKKTLGQVIDGLPCRCREVYRLSREECMSNKEIAIKLSISEKTVEQHITKALFYIRTKITMLS